MSCCEWNLMNQNARWISENYTTCSMNLYKWLYLLPLLQQKKVYIDADIFLYNNKALNFELKSIR